VAVHGVAASGFGRAAGEYERARPGYPDAVLELLAATGALAPGQVVVDLAAGTGKLTRQLSPSGAAVVAVEPVQAMGEALVGTTLVAAGTAEALPLRTASADLVTVAQAFHWFDAPAALAEVVRVTRPGGWLALIWNERDESVPWVKAFGDVIERHAGARPYTPAPDTGWDDLLAAAGCTRLRRLRVDHPVVATRAGVVERAASTSYVAALPDDRRAPLLVEVAGLVEDFEEPFTFPHVTDVHLAQAPRS
jgi:SAM-dependent methyltransferase